MSERDPATVRQAAHHLDLTGMEDVAARADLALLENGVALLPSRGVRVRRERFQFLVTQRGEPIERS